MEKVTIIIEKTEGKGYSAYPDREFDGYTFIGVGDTVAECQEDIKEAYAFVKESLAEEGRMLPELEFEFKYDMPSFFNHFRYLKATEVGKKAGISSSLLHQYTCGVKAAGPKQYARLRKAVDEIIAELSAASF